MPYIEPTQEHFELAIDALKNGISVMQLANDMKDNGVPFPAPSQLYDYCNSDSARQLRYRSARELFTHALSDQLIGISDTIRDPQRARNMMNARQWVAAKVNPKNYGEKLDLNVDQKVDVTIALTAARQRLKRMKQNSQLFDVTPQSQLTTPDAESDAESEIDPYS